MGWWDTDDGKTLGDGPLDEAYAFLKALSDEYQEDQERKPTLDEALAALEWALRAHGGDLLEDLADREVASLRAKLRKRPKNQEFGVGDVFRVRLGDRYAFGRVTPQAYVYEFFRVLSDRTLPIGEFAKSPTFRLPGPVTEYGLKLRRWEVIGRLPYGPGEFTPQYFLRGLHKELVECGTQINDRGLLYVDSGTRESTEEERRTLPKNAFYNIEFAEKELASVLGAKV